MSLNWNVKKIANSDTVCWKKAEVSDPARGIEAGESYMTPLTDSMIWLTMAVDFGSITEKNAIEFAQRAEIWEREMGCMMKRHDEATGTWVDRPITLEDVRAHTGLSTNVVTISTKKWLKKMATLKVEREARKLRLASR